MLRIVFISLFLSFGITFLIAQPTFSENNINSNHDQASMVWAIDVDNDGDTDIVSAAFSDDDVTWWENNGTGNFTERTIDGSLNGAWEIRPIDLDEDGDIDIIATGYNADDVVWYENDGNANPSFTLRNIDTNFNGATGIFPIDLDGDNDIDILATGVFANDVVWYESDGNANPSFTKRTIDNNLNGAISIHGEDVDGDDDIDVIVAASYADDVVWYENDGNANPSFTLRNVDTNFDGAYTVYCVDIDKDGDNDVIAGAANADDVVWYENDGNANPSFTLRTIDNNLNGVESVYFADLDSDGDIDVLAAAFDADDVVWYESDGNANPSFTKRTIDNNLDGACSVHFADFDDDCQLDVVAAGWQGDDVVWYENNISSSCGLDTDGDGIYDFVDLDDDNDGLLDTDEGVGSCPSEEIIDNVTTGLNVVGDISDLHDGLYQDNFYFQNNQGYPGAKTNIFNITFTEPLVITELKVVLDRDDSFMENNVQYRVIGYDGSNYVALTPFLTSNGVAEGNEEVFDLSNNSTAYISYRIRWVGGGQIGWDPWIHEIEFTVGPCPYGSEDTDSDGVPNYLDLDSDNDGIWDAVEAGHGETITNGRLTGDVGTNGVDDDVETTTESGILNYTIANTDGDLIYDFLEIDADNDSCNDTDEEGVNDPDSDGIAGTGTPAVDTNGMVTSITYVIPTNNDWKNASSSPACGTQPCTTLRTNRHISRTIRGN